MKNFLAIILSILLLISSVLFITAAAQEETTDISPFVSPEENCNEYIINDKSYILYDTELFADLNNDGKMTPVDARIMLRVSLSLETIDIDISLIDTDQNGKLTAIDARNILRSALRLDKYVLTKDKKIVSGFAKCGNDTLYIKANGALATGLTTIDSKTYYFDFNNIMKTGFVNANGNNYYFNNDGQGQDGLITISGDQYLFIEGGKAANGFTSYNGNKYFANNGKLHTGWLEFEGAKYYLNKDGKLHTGWLELDGAKYYLNKDGKLHIGWLDLGGTKYYLNKDGKLHTGWLDQSGVRYYFNKNGTMAVNTTVDGIKIGSDGKAVTVDKSFFDDAVFIGDSISVSLMYYQRQNGVLGKAQVYAASSLSAANALWEVSSRSVHPSYNGNKTLVEDCVKYSGAKKLFIMLGMNDIGIYSHDKSIQNYKELIGRVKAKSPNIEVYIQSMTPMTSISTRADARLNNTAIKQYNAKLKAMAQEMGWHYIDMYKGLSDSSGYLPTSYCGDPVYMGIHLNNTGCAQWAKYLIENVAFS